ncbi:MULTISPECIES: hypothetical protein [unclassified Brevundimonas]|uniref:hypothetical protein n=1 Tax=unclassified Brevundimonas TaxID=2622653 RepID=UPI0025BBFE89|nr:MULTISPECIES: hypothetical protein [unclassified Brevundimonas]
MILPTIILTSGLALAQASDKTERQPETPRVSWSVLPAPTETDFPETLQSLGLTGKAVVICVADAEGRARECVVKARPAGLGLEQHAVEVVKRGRIKANWPGDTPENLSFSVRLPFGSDMIPLLQPADSWTGPTPTPEQVELATRTSDEISAMRKEEPSDDLIPPALEAALATEVEPEKAAFIRRLYQEHGISTRQARALNIRMMARMIALTETSRPLEFALYFDEPEIQELMRDAEAGEGVLASAWRIQADYCARFDCGADYPEEPDTPEHWRLRDDEPFPTRQPAD